MDGYSMSRKWFDWSFENPEKISPNHTALYFFAIEHCNRLGWRKKFGFPTEMAKDAIGIKSYNTYIKTLNDLVEWGFIEMIERSKNQYSSNIIALSDFDKALDKALDKAMGKHEGKQRESISSINKQENIEHRNIETISSKEDTTQALTEVKEKKEYGDPIINSIIDTIKQHNNGIIDGTIASNRKYGKMLRDKIANIKGFSGDYVGFLDYLISRTDQYNISKTTSCESIYYNLASLVAKIKTTHVETKQKEEETKPKTWRLQSTTSLTTI